MPVNYGDTEADWECLRCHVKRSSFEAAERCERLHLANPQACDWADGCNPAELDAPFPGGNLETQAASK